MATSSSACSTFSLFPKLPAELRNKIWHESLPTKLGPALFIWRKECQSHRIELVPLPPDDFVVEDPTLIITFDVKKLGTSRVEVLPAFVDRESHSIARSWIHGRGLKYDKQRSTFGLPFNPEYDTVYIPYSAWDTFYGHYNLVDLTLDKTGIWYTRHHTPITCLAIPETLLYEHNQLINNIFHHLGYGDVQLLLVVMNAETDSMLNDAQQNRRWEILEAEQGGSFFYAEEPFRFELRNRSHNIWETEYRRVEQAIQVLLPRLYDRWTHPISLRNQGMAFEVRPVFAVCK